MSMSSQVIRVTAYLFPIKVVKTHLNADFLIEPCKTLPQALLMVSDGGKICLDGRESESHPYSCEH